MYTYTYLFIVFNVRFVSVRFLSYFLYVLSCLLFMYFLFQHIANAMRAHLLSREPYRSRQSATCDAENSRQDL